MLHPIAERILDGEQVCDGEIRTTSAQRIIAVEEHWARVGPHTPKECKSAKPKDCTHGQGSNLWFVDVLLQEAHDACSCGQHRLP